MTRLVVDLDIVDGFQEISISVEFYFDLISHIFSFNWY